eukprot:TRINITY_DN28959_c0_g1_i1.p1 TRINITY_DN28959_c0_g1~~TRINITY_DN28959_c0_g1_i1.p1  ORF type:complete len:220 (-),score=20.35 TRINITY_DN28959_c0_g1_i1:35-649(-)
MCIRDRLKIYETCAVVKNTTLGYKNLGLFLLEISNLIQKLSKEIVGILGIKLWLSENELLVFSSRSLLNSFSKKKESLNALKKEERLKILHKVLTLAQEFQHHSPSGWPRLTPEVLIFDQGKVMLSWLGFLSDQWIKQERMGWVNHLMAVHDLVKFLVPEENGQDCPVNGVFSDYKALMAGDVKDAEKCTVCLLYTSPSPRDQA